MEKSIVKICLFYWLIKKDDGQKVDSESINKYIGFCSQDDNLLLNNTVVENLKLFAEIRGMHKDEIEVATFLMMKKFKLDQYKDTRVSKLDRDTKRILSISIALLNNPKIIILDEPTSGIIK